MSTNILHELEESLRTADEETERRILAWVVKMYPGLQQSALQMIQNRNEGVYDRQPVRTGSGCQWDPTEDRPAVVHEIGPLVCPNRATTIVSPGEGGQALRGNWWLRVCDTCARARPLKRWWQRRPLPR